MGYFDALTSGTFKTTQDGRRLFFPWGVLGSGYCIASEQDYQRLRQQVKGYMIVTLVLIIAAGSFKGYVVSVVVAALLTTAYVAWMWHLLRRLKNSGERLSLQESMTSQANASGALVLWLLEIASLALIGGGIFMVVVDPSQWPVALASIIFSGLCAAKMTRMLVLRRRTAGVER
jgi:Ca2+/Na+ antiporter